MWTFFFVTLSVLGPPGCLSHKLVAGFGVFELLLSGWTAMVAHKLPRLAANPLAIQRNRLPEHKTKQTSSKGDGGGGAEDFQLRATCI